MSWSKFTVSGDAVFANQAATQPFTRYAPGVVAWRRKRSKFQVAARRLEQVPGCKRGLLSVAGSALQQLIPSYFESKGQKWTKQMTRSKSEKVSK
jgi:hypothetical protein